MMDVELYATADGKEVVAEYLDTLPAKSQAKVFRDIELLAEYAPDLHEPHAKHIDGALWELRSKFGSNIYRMFYFIWQGNTIILLHGFTKKTQKTPPNEIRIAKNRLADYERRNRE